MKKSAFALNFAIKYYIAIAVLVSVGYFLEIDIPSAVGLVLTLFVFAWSCQLYLDKNGINQSPQVKRQLLLIGLLISCLPQIPLLALMMWAAEMPIWIFLIAALVGSAFTYLVLHFGFTMAQNMLIKRDLQKAKSTT